MRTIPIDTFPLLIAIAGAFALAVGAAWLSFRNMKRTPGQGGSLCDPLFILGGIFIAGGVLGGIWAIAKSLPYMSLSDQVTYPQTRLYLVAVPSVFLGSLMAVPGGIAICAIAIAMQRYRERKSRR
jgi:hypothetical protein